MKKFDMNYGYGWPDGYKRPKTDRGYGWPKLRRQKWLLTPNCHYCRRLLVVACVDCNQEKGNRLPEEFRCHK